VPSIPPEEKDPKAVKAGKEGGKARATKLSAERRQRIAERAAYALHFAFYNFCRIHKTLRVTPAMEVGIADHVWTLDELIAA
jgi:hypothetical protein